MARKLPSLLKALAFLSKIPTKVAAQRNPSFLQWKASNLHDNQIKIHKYTSVVHQSRLSDQTLIFDVEGALLKSSSLFPYFMLVALEGGGILRALILFLLYPFLCLFGRELMLKVMVFFCFVGIRKESFRIGRSVLPKHFLEDVGCEGFDFVMSFGRKLAVSDLPVVMVEGFLKDYLGIEAVVGRELKVVHGFFIGLMEDKKANEVNLNGLFKEAKLDSHHAIGFGRFSNFLNYQQIFAHCKELYWVTHAEKRNWHILPRNKYPKPLIFHDGRLAFRPSPQATLAMLMYIPLGIFLMLIRYSTGLFLPYEINLSILALTGMRHITLVPKNLAPSNKKEGKRKGLLYVCNHRTLLDPIYISLALSQNSDIAAVTYSMSKFNELMAPLKTVQLTRDREKDAKMMEEMLSWGDLVVCPEGTTCREPYLLRFSPLFAEMTDDIVPVAIDVKVSMFYGSTASGLKCLDPVFQLLNPSPTYHIKFLSKLPSEYTCQAGKKSRIEVASYVQKEIAKALGYECTDLTRKDKYTILAGNSGIVK